MFGDNEYVITFGYRTYCIKQSDVSEAREIYAQCTGTQEQFEIEMEEAGIEFIYEYC